MALDDVAPLWLVLLDLPADTPRALAPAPIDLGVHAEPPAHAGLPAPKAYYPPGARAARLTPALVQLLPGAAPTRARILTAVEDTLRMHPCVNARYLRTRIEALFGWAKDEETRAPSSNPKADLARAIFFGGTERMPTPSLSFFAAVCAAHALGVSVIKENESYGADEREAHARKAARTDDASSSPTATTSSASASAGRVSKPLWAKVSASALFALSQQALDAHEHGHAYDTDYVLACILQTLFLLYDGKPRIAHVVYPLVGKMAAVAGMMGLGSDPDEAPGRYSVFEAEMRRRVWWDVYYYDVCVLFFSFLCPRAGRC
jgi:hypothetical protein